MLRDAIIEINNKKSDSSDLSIEEVEVNKRCKLFVGNAGSGKFAEASKYADFCQVITGADNPTSLLLRLSFANGKSSYDISMFVMALKFGKTVLIDDINDCSDKLCTFFDYILSHDTLNLKDFCSAEELKDIKETEIKISPDFKLIGTATPSSWRAMIK